MRHGNRPRALNVLALALGILALATVFAVGPAAAAKQDKVTICHVPPGNEENAHTIVIAEAAVDAHMANHDDYEGECDEGGGDGD